MTDLPTVRDITRITYQPDDVIVARLHRPIDIDTARKLNDLLKEAFPGLAVLIVDPSLELAVMAPADAPTGIDLSGEEPS